MKTETVKSCSGCPFRRPEHHDHPSGHPARSHHYCSMDQELREVNPAHDAPDWCPLRKAGGILVRFASKGPVRVPGYPWDNLFKLLDQEHTVIALQTEMEDIASAVDEDRAIAAENLTEGG